MAHTGGWLCGLGESVHVKRFEGAWHARSARYYQLTLSVLVCQARGIYLPVYCILMLTIVQRHRHTR